MTDPLARAYDSPPRDLVVSALANVLEQFTLDDLSSVVGNLNGVLIGPASLSCQVQRLRRSGIIIQV